MASMASMASMATKGYEESAVEMFHNTRPDIVAIAKLLDQLPKEYHSIRYICNKALYEQVAPNCYFKQRMKEIMENSACVNCNSETNEIYPRCYAKMNS